MVFLKIDSFSTVVTIKHASVEIIFIASVTFLWSKMDFKPAEKHAADAMATESDKSLYSRTVNEWLAVKLFILTKIKKSILPILQHENFV